MNQPHILLVEDEPFIAKVIQESLEQKGYKVTHASDGKKGYSLFMGHLFAICILDVMLPYTDGYTLAKQIRSQQVSVPVLFLTARTATADVIAGYESGGNDYLKKPFSLEELFLRVKELIRRSKPAKSTTSEFRVGKFLFIPHQQQLRYESERPVQLSYRETQLLQMLYEHRNALLERREVLLALWGDDSFFTTRTMDVFILKLRKHLAQDQNIQILNLRGVGFKLIC